MVYYISSGSHFLRFWAFKPFYNVTNVTLSHLNSINAIDVIRGCGYLLTIFGTILGLSWNYLGTILGLSWDYLGTIFGTILGLSWDYLGTILGLSWDYLGTIMGLSLSLSLSIRLILTERTSGVPPVIFSNVVIKSWFSIELCSNSRITVEVFGRTPTLRGHWKVSQFEGVKLLCTLLNWEFLKFSLQFPSQSNMGNCYEAKGILQEGWIGGRLLGRIVGITKFINSTKIKRK